MVRTLKFMGFLALIVVAHLLWSRHAEYQQGERNAARFAATTTAALATPLTDSSLASTAASPVTRTPASWPMYRGDAAMTGACEGQLGDKLEFAWRFRAGKDAASADKAAVKSSAVIDGGRVSIGANDGRVYAIALDSGQELWPSFQAGAAVSAPPMLLGDSVIVGDERGVVYCLDAADGDTRWTTMTGAKVVAAANHFVDTAGKDCLLVGSWDRSLYCFAADDGLTLWSIPMGNYVNAPCSLADDMAVLPVCDGSIRVLDLAQRKAVLEISTSGMVASAVSLRSGRGYAADSNGADNLYCIDLSSGDVVWRKLLSGPTLGPVSVTADYVLVATSAASGAALHCFTLDGEVAWRHDMSAGSSAGPLVVGDRVLLGGDDGYLRLLRLSDGECIWQYRVGGPIESSPAVAGGYVVVGCNDGYVYAFKVE